MPRPAFVIPGFVLLSTLALRGQCPFSQTLPPGLEDQLTSAGSEIFHTAAGDSTIVQWIYNDTLFLHQGPITITELYVRAGGSSLPPFYISSMEITLASATAPIGFLTTFMPANLGPDATVVRPMSAWAGGPVSTGGTPSSCFISLGLTTPFVYNPALGLDLVVQVRVCGVVAPWAGGTCVVGQNPNVARYRRSSTCVSGPGQQQGSQSAVLLKVDYVENDTMWQVNHPESSLTAPGFPGTGSCAPIEVDAVVGMPTTFALASTSTGLGWELGFMVAPPVPKSPSNTTPGGEVLHLNVQDPTFGTVFQFGNLSSTPFAPFQNVNLQLVPTAPAPVVTAQMANLAPLLPDGFALSAPIQLHVRPQVQNLGFTTDDEVKVLHLSTLDPAGSITSVPFFGHSYNEIYVTANGRLMFGAGSTSYYPNGLNFVTDPPSVGYYSDFSPQAAGASVTATASGGVVVVAYNNVPHWASTVPTNFSIAIDSVTGGVTVSGVNTIVPVANQDAVLGISAGYGGFASDSGPTSFVLGGPFNPPPGILGTVPSIYAVGPVGTLAPTINGLIFMPMGLNYTWMGF